MGACVLVISKNCYKRNYANIVRRVQLSQEAHEPHEHHDSLDDGDIKVASHEIHQIKADATNTKLQGYKAYICQVKSRFKHCYENGESNVNLDNLDAADAVKLEEVGPKAVAVKLEAVGPKAVDGSVAHEKEDADDDHDDDDDAELEVPSRKEMKTWCDLQKVPSPCGSVVIRAMTLK